ncbi:MAG TPA: hypothetical protein VFH27_13430, partial [Longimicrobiaceae bacterium]|nr:hypothetical protein [Longimicrobiaceae bacterium]
MKTLTLVRGVVAAAALVLASRPAHAQFGGALRGLGHRATQAAVNAVAGPAQQPAVSHTPGQPALSDVVLEITPARLDQLARGLAVEDTLHAGADERASARYIDAYQACEGRLASGDARYRELVAANARAQGDAADSTYWALDAYRAPRCGRNPQMHAREINAVASRAAGMGRRQYTILKERVVPFCQRGGAVGRYVYSAS